MRVLVLNSGSSSLKYRLFDLAADPQMLSAGAIERVGEDGGDAADHEQALHRVFAELPDDEIGGIGHRVVHGGETFVEPTLVDQAVVDGIRRLSALAPLHNPANLRGIEVASELRPDVPQVAVFDTAFHRTLPPAAYRYAVPESVYRDYGVRRYGFHGTSHAHVARRAAEALERPPGDCNLVTLHLGNGSSAAAIAGGRSVDTSMGLSPLEGLVMGTRSGDLDPAVVFHLIREAGMTPDEVETLLNRRSGLLGLSGENDLRRVEERAGVGDESAALALDVMAHRLRKYVGAYVAVLGRVDALVFTGGIGQYSALVRERVCADLDGLGIAVDASRNAAATGRETTDIATAGATTRVLVVPTDEELEIAQQTAARIRALRS